MIPQPQEQAVDDKGRITRNWYQFFRSLAAPVAAPVQAVAVTFQTLWSGLLGYGFLTRNSIGTPVFRKIVGTTGRTVVTNGDANNGDPTIDLATVTDAGGGTLQKTAFDSYGRKTGTSAATTSDLPEGTGLYFTAARVLATVLAGLSTATSAVITASDTVLSALGKLQAQISANVTALGTKADKATTISTTAPLTGGGDLSANRTLSIPAATASVDGYLKATDFAAFAAINSAFITSSNGQPLMTSAGDFITTSGA